MFVRWKKGSYNTSAYLVQSERRDGQPRQTILAHLCTFPTRHMDGEHPAQWGEAEYQMRRLHLDEDAQEKVYQELATKTPRLSPERIEEAYQTYAAAIQAEASSVVPDIPPAITEADTTEEEIFPYLIKWQVEQPRPKFGKPAKFTALLAKQVISSGRKRVQIVTRLHKEEMTLQDLQGIFPRGDGTTIVSHRWKRFWYQVHSALLLVPVDTSLYSAIITRLSTWVKQPAQEDFFAIIQELQQYEERTLSYQLDALQRSLNRLSKRGADLQTIRSRSESYLGKPLSRSRTFPL
jgi:hypothetical protein